MDQLRYIKKSLNVNNVELAELLLTNPDNIRGWLRNSIPTEHQKRTNKLVRLTKELVAAIGEIQTPKMVRRPSLLLGQPVLKALSVDLDGTIAVLRKVL